MLPEAAAFCLFFGGQRSAAETAYISENAQAIAIAAQAWHNHLKSTESTIITLEASLCAIASVTPFIFSLCIYRRISSGEPPSWTTNTLEITEVKWSTLHHLAAF